MDTLTRDALLLLLGAVRSELGRSNSLQRDVEQLRVALTALRECTTPEEEEKIDKKLRELAIHLLGLEAESDTTISKLDALAKRLNQVQ